MTLININYVIKQIIYIFKFWIVFNKEFLQNLQRNFIENYIAFE
jgi:hypothetical protein